MKTVLLVDDDLGIREAVSQSLQARGYFVLVVKDGTEAITCVQNDCHANKIDIVITDFQMTHVHGDKVTEFSLNAYKPVIMMTGNMQRARYCVNMRSITDGQLKKFRLLEKGSFTMDDLDMEIKKLCG